MHASRQLYALVMDLELRHLRCLVAIVDSGTFTDAAIELGISQAAVSRNLMALEQVLGVRLLHRTSRTITPTTAGVHALAQARQVLAAAGNLVAEATTGHTRLRIGHAWAAMGRHTREFQRRWAARYPDVELHLIRTNSATGGLAEDLCDIAVLRRRPARPHDRRRRNHRLVGTRRTATTPMTEPCCAPRAGCRGLSGPWPRLTTVERANRSARTSAWFRSRQWPSRSEHSVPAFGAGPDQRHLSGHPWRSTLSIALQPHGFIGRGPGSAQLAPRAREAPGRGRRSTGSRAAPRVCR